MSRAATLKFFSLPFDPQELVTMVGAPRESTNKALAAFRRQGLIRLQRG
ncbi:MAG: helix-turn-helix domain-containing protein [bacterium]